MIFGLYEQQSPCTGVLGHLPRVFVFLKVHRTVMHSRGEMAFFHESEGFWGKKGGVWKKKVVATCKDYTP
jgi:hypothetical protein